MPVAAVGPGRFPWACCRAAWGGQGLRTPVPLDEAGDGLANSHGRAEIRVICSFFLNRTIVIKELLEMFVLFLPVTEEGPARADF